MRVNVVDPMTLTVAPYAWTQDKGRYALSPLEGECNPEDVYLSPPWIDSHVHCFYAVTSFGLEPDEIGYKQGVHMLIDAGSAGAETFAAFRRFVAEPSLTRVRAFLNVSSVGHVTMREYYDKRCVDVERAARTVADNRDLLLGIKARSSAIIVEERGIWPLEQAVRAAELADCPVMVHLGENPPTNEENLALLRRNDIATHCFHGKVKPLFTEDGEPIEALRQAIDRGVQLDVGHGAASFDRDVCAAALARGIGDFSISTDLHIRNVRGPVYSLPDTMSKFLALGMPLARVIRAVTAVPAARFGLDSWCSCLTRNATLFRLAPVTPQDHPFTDSVKKPIDVRLRIQPTAVLMDGRMIPLEVRHV